MKKTIQKNIQKFKVGKVFFCFSNSFFLIFFSLMAPELIFSHFHKSINVFYANKHEQKFPKKKIFFLT